MIRRSVPLALAMISTSSPKLQILDTLSKFSHDSDAEVAHNSILAMGLVGAGRSTCKTSMLIYYSCRPVHPPYSSVFVMEFNPEYGNTDLLIWLPKRSSSKYGNAHHLNIFFTVISCVKNVAPSVGNGACSPLLCSMPGHAQYTLGPVTCIDNVVDNARVGYHQMASYVALYYARCQATRNIP